MRIRGLAGDGIAYSFSSQGPLCPAYFASHRQTKRPQHDTSISSQNIGALLRRPAEARIPVSRHEKVTSRGWNVLLFSNELARWPSLGIAAHQHSRREKGTCNRAFPVHFPALAWRRECRPWARTRHRAFAASLRRRSACSARFAAAVPHHRSAIGPQQPTTGATDRRHIRIIPC